MHTPTPPQFLKKVTALFPSNPPLKAVVPLFENLVKGSSNSPPTPQPKRVGAHYVTAQSSFQKLNLGCQKARNSRYQTPLPLSKFTGFLYIVQTILYKIVEIRTMTRRPEIWQISKKPLLHKNKRFFH